MCKELLRHLWQKVKKPNEVSLQDIKAGYYHPDDSNLRYDKDQGDPDHFARQIHSRSGPDCGSEFEDWQEWDKNSRNMLTNFNFLL